MNVAKKKLIIHETDCHGCGRFYYDGKSYHYAYDDETSDIKSAVIALIDIGFINPDDVVIIDEDNIYPLVEKIFEKPLDKQQIMCYNNSTK